MKRLSTGSSHISAELQGMLYQVSTQNRDGSRDQSIHQGRTVLRQVVILPTTESIALSTVILGSLQ